MPWSTPVADELVRRVDVVFAGSGYLEIPGCSAVLPVGEPHFLGHHVHVLLVEDAGVGEEGVEIIGMRSGEVVDGVASEAGSRGAHLAYVGLFLHLVYG